MDLLNRLRNNHKLQQIAKLAGRYRNIAKMRQQVKIKKGSSEIYSIKQGKDLDRLLPSELMKFGNKITKKLFYKDFLEGKTLQYETREKKKESKGPIVFPVDESGSMCGDAEIYIS